MNKEPFRTWGLVEVMGHSRYAGLISEESIGGTSFVRIDVPEVTTATKHQRWHQDSDSYQWQNETMTRQAFTKLIGSGAIFAITPTTEEIARGLAQSMALTPISVYDLPESMRPTKQLTPLSDASDDDEPGTDETDGKPISNQEAAT